ncbi:hypothetical protein [Reyranella sp.]|uniref:hypothetical protein n=1 Tax=Reyranella sp. TaxID=1929291 RepID=UPI003D149900
MLAMTFRPAFFACVAALVLLSWLPGDEMVRTGANGRAEHAVAYFGTVVMMALAYRERPRLLVQTILLVALAGILEAGQLYAPGRTAALFDFASSSAGAGLGGLLMWALRPRLLNFAGLDRLTVGRG